MRWTIAVFMFASCTKPAPQAITPTVDVPDSAPAAAAPPSSSSSSSPAPAPTDVGLDGLPASWPPALLARLARAADSVPAGKVDLAPPADAERDKVIRARFGEHCRLERTCGALYGIDCDAAVDGPYYYVRVRTDRVEELAGCGGMCMGGRCTNCPPRDQGWTCKTY